jgi:ribosomal protein S18 acetylase RimI-like enzyme
MSTTLRQATAEDVPGIQRVRRRVRENRLVTAVIRDEDVLQAIEDTGRGWVVDSDGEVVGFAIGNARTGNIWALFVDPDHEGRGHGWRLHDTMVAWLWPQGLERLWLTTEPGTRAQRFYQAAGWRLVGPTGQGEVRFEKDRPPAALSLRPTTAEDVPFVVAAERAPECEGLVGNWPPSEHREALADPTRVHLVAEEAGERVGFAILYDLGAVGCGVYLKRIVAVGKGQGVGRRMLAGLSQYCRARFGSPYVWLGVYPHNERAIHCYRAAGYRPMELPGFENERHRRLADPGRLDQCLLFRRDLETPPADA